MRRFTDHIDLIDYIRGIAIAAVFCFHSLYAAFGTDELAWAGWVPDFAVSRSFLVLLPATFGWVGVPIFFVVSGFCIHLSFCAKAPTRVSDFYIRRFFRIYPPYLMALLFFALLFPGTRLAFASRTDWAQFGSHLLLIHNFDARSYFGINAAMWSIAIEVQLYLLYPFLLALVARLGWSRALWLVGILEITMHAASGWYSTVTDAALPRWFTGSPFYFWFSWSIGAAVADALLEHRPLPFKNHSLAAWLLLAIGASNFRPLATFSFLLFSVATAVGMARFLGGFELTRRLPRFCAEHLRFAGVWSYSIYLLHQPLVTSVPSLVSWVRPGTSVHPLLMFAVCAGSWLVIVPLSARFYHYCEVPSINLGKWIVQRGQAVAPATCA